MLKMLIVAGLQLLEPVPELAEPGTVVEVRAVDATGEPIEGLPVEVLTPDGSLESLGRTDVGGIVTFEARIVGEHLIRASFPAPSGPATMLSTPYHVVAQPPRWLWAMACVPLGLVLLWVNLRRWRGRLPPPSVDV